MKYSVHGLKDLQNVDLNGALTGKSVNLDIIQQLVSKHDLTL